LFPGAPNQKQLFKAVVKGNLSLIKRASPEQLFQGDHNGFTLTTYAALHGQVGILKYLRLKGLNLKEVDRNGLFPVYLAAKNNHGAVIRMLTADELDAAYYYAFSAASVASKQQSFDALLALREIGVDLAAQDEQGIDLKKPDDTGMKPAHAAIRAEDKRACLRSIRALTVDELDVLDNDGFSIATLAASFGDLVVLRALLKCGISLRREDGAGRSALGILEAKGITIPFPLLH